MTKNDDIVLPGDKIAVLEEYMAGEGTYVHEGKIFASTVGRVEMDTKSRVIRVRAINPPVTLRSGSVVYGTVTDIRSPIVTVELLGVMGASRNIAGDNMASLHVSKISTAYTTEIRRDLRIGDIVRAEVIQVKPSLQLTTARPNLGVIRAWCARCRRPLVKMQDGLYCQSCEHSEPRKMAKDYGDFSL